MYTGGRADFNKFSDLFKVTQMDVRDDLKYVPNSTGV